MIDISYTQAPPWVKLMPELPHDPHTSFWDLAVLSFPEGRKESLREPLESEVNKVRLPPDEQMLCYDYLYFVSAKRASLFLQDLLDCRTHERLFFSSRSSSIMTTLRHGKASFSALPSRTSNSGPRRYVGRHLRWSTRVQDLVDEYVRRTIGVAEEEKTPTVREALS